MRMVISLLFPLLFLSASVWASCPSEQSVSPCECDDEEDYVDLICAGKSTTLEQVKTALQALDRNDPVTLLLDEMDLGSVPSNFFQGFNIKKLEISHCELDSLSSDGGKPLTGLEDTLEELEIMSSFTEDNKPTKLELGHLKRLSEVDMSYNAITELGNDWFENGPTTLTHVLFSNNGIQKVGDTAFAKLFYLRSLHFDGNRFGSLKTSMLPNPALALEDLELDNNALTSIPDDLFSNMPSLKKLSLRTNGLTRLPENTFKPVWDKLEVIDLRGNPLECDSHLDWISKLESEISVFGRCESPADQRGVELSDFIGGR